MWRVMQILQRCPVSWLFVGDERPSRIVSMSVFIKNSSEISNCKWLKNIDLCLFYLEQADNYDFSSRMRPN